MDLEDTVFSETSQTERDKYHMILLLRGIQNKINEQTQQKQTHKSRKHFGADQAGTGLGGGVEGGRNEDAQTARYENRRGA